MATTTENLGLTLPAGTDRALVSVLNENFQTLDDFAGQATADIQEAQETANAAAPQATTYTKDEVDAAIEEAIEHGGGGTTDYTDLTNKPSINGVVLAGNKTTSDLGIEENAQADWDEADTTAPSYIKNKPNIPSGVVVDTTYDGTSENAQAGTAVAQAISTKVDKETGKGLSTNDFTNTDKANLETALTKANTAAPQSTTYTKNEVDTALAEKLNTADVDAALSSTSINPVQNRAVQAPIARLVNAGAKNLLKVTATSQTINGVTFTVLSDTDTIIINGTATANTFFSLTSSFLLSAGVFNLSGCPSGYNRDGARECRLFVEGFSFDRSDIGEGVTYTMNEAVTASITFEVYAGAVMNNAVIKPMLCTAEDYAISQEFVPYTPTMRELYEMLIALQNAQNGG